MSQRINEFGQPIGEDVLWRPSQTPPQSEMVGRYCKVVPLNVDHHAKDLFEAYALDETGKTWTYLFTDPFKTEADLRVWLTEACLGDDPMFHVVVDLDSGKAVGFAAYMRIDVAMGVIEVGNINFSPVLQKTPAATEAMFLMMRRVFNELGYRRYEWKCDNLNVPSHKAALRFGFTYEGLFRQAIMYKGRNRDTAWFSIIDTEWPALEKSFNAWLDPSNFDAEGRQRRSLGSFRV